jgi:ATP-dependent Clp protease adaptor protein ClpS
MAMADALPQGKSVIKASPASRRKPRRAGRKQTRRQNKPLPQFHVVLLDDNDHTYEYVIEMLQLVFTHNRQVGFQLARQVDSSGRAIVMTTHKEMAELKVEQVRAYGADWRISRCKGSMSAVIEPAS